MMAHELFPRTFFLERLLLSKLVEHFGDFRKAVLSVPRPRLLLYVRSYFSYLWNVIASKLIETIDALPALPSSVPLPGYHLCGGPYKEAYEELLNMDGLSLACCNSLSPFPHRASFRPLVVHPSSVKCTLVEYHHHRQQIFPNGNSLVKQEFGLYKAE